jgi:hypothetical protein
LTAATVLSNCPPSEKLSGVTLTIPIKAGWPENSMRRLGNCQNDARCDVFFMINLFVTSKELPVANAIWLLHYIFSRNGKSKAPATAALVTAP